MCVHEKVLPPVCNRRLGEKIGSDHGFSCLSPQFGGKSELALQRWLTFFPKKVSLGFEGLNVENLPMFVLIVSLQLSTTVRTLSNMLHNINNFPFLHHRLLLV